MSALAVCRDASSSRAKSSQLIVPRERISAPVRVIRAVERAVPIAEISFALHQYYQIGNVVEAPEGWRVEATLPILWCGRRVEILGLLSPLVGSDVHLVLPLATFT